MNNKNVQFNSDTNILGGVPDYATMIQYVVASLDNSVASDFSFRTEKAGKRFIAAIDRSILTFKNDEHKRIILSAFSSNDLRFDQKLIVLFWQLCINNKLFALITENYFMKSVFAGRLSLLADEIMSYLYQLRSSYPDELQWSDATLKITASKYLTVMKKLGLALGTQNKVIKYPVIGDEVFEILVRLALNVYPEEPTGTNPLFSFSFLDKAGFINKIKSIKFTNKWTVMQLGNNIKIELLS